MSSDPPVAAPRGAPSLVEIGPAGLVLLAAAILLGWFVLDGNVGIDFADEGYLWYGTLAIRRGELPMRDFQGYDPGRYFWTGAWSLLFGQSLVGMRAACTIFSILGVSAGLLVARRLTQQPLVLVLVAFALSAWMHPRYKCFEQSIALMAVYAGVLLLEGPHVSRHFAVGIFGGLMAVMGRNHGLYHLAAFAPLVMLAGQGASIPERLRRAGAWIGGCLVGYLPQWALFFHSADYYAAFLHYMHSIVSKGTNLARSVPWPWRVPAEFANWRWASAFLEGCFFLAIPVVAVLGTYRLLRGVRENRADHLVLAAAVCVLVPYSHFAFSRPDAVHLGHAAPVLVLAILALAASGRAAALAATAIALLATGFLANLFETGLSQRLFARYAPLAEVEIAGRTMRLRQPEKALADTAREVADQLAKSDEPVFFGPHHPGFYPLTGRVSPVRHLYFIFPASPEEELASIGEFERNQTKWVLLGDRGTDGRDDLTMRKTNPRFIENIESQFEPVPLESPTAGFQVFRRRFVR